MLGLLTRHEVEVLLKAGHKGTEVARLTGISPSSVRRIAGEPPIEHFNDTVERRKRRIGRPSIVEGFRKIISDILEKEAGRPSLDILRQTRKAGYSGSKTALYALEADGVEQTGKKFDIDHRTRCADQFLSCISPGHPERLDLRLPECALQETRFRKTPHRQA